MSPIRSPTRVGSSLSCKHRTGMEVTFNDKQTNLLLYEINYDLKKFYQTEALFN